MKLLVKNGILPEYGKCDLLVEEGLIAKIAPSIEDADAEVIDAKGQYVLPGMVDLHCHLRDPGYEYKEDIVSGSKAAAKGGFTSICCMANTNPVNDNAVVTSYIVNKAKNEGSGVHVYPIGALSHGLKGETMAEIGDMAKAGAVAISDDGKPVMNAHLMRLAMEYSAAFGLTVFDHCEDINLVNGGVINADTHARELGLKGITNSVEDIIVARDIMLSHDTGAKLHLCHCSTEDSVMMVDLAKQKNVKVTAEVCPHHFTLTSDDIRKIAPEMDVEKNVIAADADADTNFKMNPPLRTKKDVEALRVGLRDNIMDVISTDHAPHTFADKNTSMKNAPFGIVGLETAACLTYTELVLGGYLTPMQMAEKMSYNPAKIVGLDKGDIAPGKTADIVIFDPNETYKIDKNKFASKGRNTPFDGRTVTGKVKMTIVGGHIVYEE